MPLTVLHLTGSPTDALSAELSHLYARDCLAATADAERYTPHIADVLPGGAWRFPRDLGPAALCAADELTAAQAVARICSLGVDVVVPQMFCLAGMTSYRALLDLLGIPYVGNTPLVMALAADKAKARAVMAAAGIDVPAGEVVRPGGRPALALPVVVKPVDADNSLGVTLVRHESELQAALDAAFAHSRAALVESYVELGREVRCGVLDRDGTLVCLPLEEYRVDAHHPVRVVEDKLRRDSGGALSLAAKDGLRAWIVDPADPLTERVWEVARRCHVALGARHYSLFDFRVDPDGRPWFLEAGPYCSFAEQSVISVMAAAAGTDVAELFAATIGAAVAPRAEEA